MRDKQFLFARDYLNVVQSVFPKKLQSGVPPTPKEIDTEGTAMWIRDYKGKVVTVGETQININNILGDWTKATAGLQSKMYLDKAMSCKVYVDPEWISLQRDMSDATKPPSETSIWFAQNMLWVQGDVVDAIAGINANSKNVTESPIKHIIRLEMADDVSQYLVVPATSGADATAAPVGKSYGLTPTGRTSNPLYDVATFTLTMNVESRKINSILADLARNRLITIKDCETASVDGVVAAQNGYLYGPVTVSKITVRGEELLLREWTVPLMPDSIKTMLQIPITVGAPLRAATN
jgi:hypothetical protein